MRRGFASLPAAMRAFALAIGLLAAAAAATAQDEVPFITTPDKVTLAMLELAGVGPPTT